MEILQHLKHLVRIPYYPLVKIRPFRYGNLQYGMKYKNLLIVKIRPFRYGNVAYLFCEAPTAGASLKSDRFGMEIKNQK